MKRSGALVAFGLVAVVAFVAHGAEQAPDYDVKAAFDQTDQNHDGAIEIDEFHERLVDIFFLGDADKDGFLTEEEFVKVVVIKEDYALVDKNGDGKVSKREFVSARLTEFVKLDTDDDGSLSLGEVEAALAGRAAK
jgi:Ca2+-binding EF-hand superfamily protein